MAKRPPPSAPRARTIHRVSVVAGLVVLGLALASIVIVGPPRPCGALPARYPPIIAFELARSGADLHAIFGTAPGPCRSTMVAAMDAANLLDLALFTPAYGLFLLTAFVGLGRRGRALAGTGARLAVLAVVADVLENLCLLGLVPAIDPTSRWLAILPFATGVKWLALGAAGAVACVGLWPGGRWAKLGAVLCLVTPIATVAAIADPHRFGPLVGAGVAVSWLAILADGLGQVRARA